MLGCQLPIIGGISPYPYLMKGSIKGDVGTSYLIRTFTVGDANEWVMSFWVKPVAYYDYMILYYAFRNGDNHHEIAIDAGQKLRVRHVDDNSTVANLYANTSLPLNEWTHIAIEMDTTLTANDRMSIWNNGTEDSLTVGNAPQASGNNIFLANASYPQRIYGQQGRIAQIIGIPGMTMADIGGINMFGESRNGIWVPKKFDWDALGTVNVDAFEIDPVTLDDEGPNETTWTHTGGGMLGCIDTPDTDFNTLAYVSGRNLEITGGDRLRSLATSYRYAFSGLPVPDKGKWYCEFEAVASNDYWTNHCALVEGNDFTAGEYVSQDTGRKCLEYRCGGAVAKEGPVTLASGLTTWEAGSGVIVGLKIDMDSLTAEFTANGVSQYGPYDISGWAGDIYISVMSYQTNSITACWFGDTPFSYQPAGYNPLINRHSF